jgi:outer membrane protein assembly factor BamB
VPILEDFIELLDARGNPLRKLSLLEAFERSTYAEVARARYARGEDLFHINTLTLLEGRIAEQLPAFRAGNVLISSFPMHVIAVVDLEQETISWLQTGSYRSQHDPQVLDNGHLLLFDNRGGNRGERRASAVLELDPASGQEHWAYRADPANQFYSSTCGAAQRLPNGNTLITESDRGRAFEVTPEQEIVWEYRNPHRAGPDGRFIATLFEAWRLPTDFPLDWLSARPDAGLGAEPQP